MEVFIVWIALSILAGVIAAQRGRSGIGFFFLAVFLSPVVGIIAALVVKPITKNVEKDKIASGESKKCPYCAELIKKEAIVCKHCGKEVAKEI